MVHTTKTLALFAAFACTIIATPLPKPDGLSSRDTNVIIPVVGYSFVANEGGYGESGKPRNQAKNPGSTHNIPSVGYSFVANEGYAEDEDRVSRPVVGHQLPTSEVPDQSKGAGQDKPHVGYSFVANEGYEERHDRSQPSSNARPVVGYSFVANEGY